MYAFHCIFYWNLTVISGKEQKFCIHSDRYRYVILTRVVQMAHFMFFIYKWNYVKQITNSKFSKTKLTCSYSLFSTFLNLYSYLIINYYVSRKDSLIVRHRHGISRLTTKPEDIHAGCAYAVDGNKIWNIDSLKKYGTSWLKNKTYSFINTSKPNLSITSDPN